FRHAALFGAEHLAGAAQFEIALGDDEAVVCFAQRFQPLLRGFAERWRIDEQTCGLRFAASDPPPELMKLRKAEALRMLDHHYGRFRNVNSNFDDGGRDKHFKLALLETRHFYVALRALHSAMNQPYGGAEHLAQHLRAVFRGCEIDQLGFLDQRTHPVRART